MGLLNQDYEEIRRQIDCVSSCFIKCKTREEFSSCFATYEALCELYKMSTGIDLFDVSGPLKLTATVVEDSFRKEKINSFYTDFFTNKDKAHALFREVYFTGVEAYIEFLRSDAGYLNSLPVKELVCDMEAMEIIYLFLDSEFPETKAIFEEMLASGRLFKSCNYDKYSDRAGYSLFNPIERLGNIFLRGPLKTVGDLSSFIHEFGHVVDLQALSKNYTSSCIPVINGLRFDIEVIPCYYQIKFLEYLIRNDIYKEEAQRELAIDFEGLFNHLENGFLVTLANTWEYEKLKYGNLTKEQFVIGLLDREALVELPEYMDMENLDCQISIPETSSYAYGISLGCAIQNKETYTKLMTNSCERDFFERVNSIGITPDTASHQLVKKIETLYA